MFVGSLSKPVPSSSPPELLSTNSHLSNADSLNSRIYGRATPKLYYPNSSQNPHAPNLYPTNSNPANSRHSAPNNSYRKGFYLTDSEPRTLIPSTRIHLLSCSRNFSLYYLQSLKPRAPLFRSLITEIFSLKPYPLLLVLKILLIHKTIIHVFLY